ncbi:MAG: RagB/SusD family nutrient uptake outer membrane protein [Dysgonamonadaceae bacterium]|nr:RagB/SusD family nutrient uptake outer membrane protein [Dysgonamonadaceae bacterium]
MKKIHCISTLLLLLAGFVSCNELDLIPESALTGSNFPLTDNDAVALINGVYVPNSDFSSNSSYLIELPADATQCGENVTSGGGAELGTFQFTPSNGNIDDAWTTLFTGVTAASSAIDKISAADITDGLKTRLIGEAKFLRAHYYFYLVQLFGDVPIVLHEDEGIGATRAPIDDVYTQIVQDLTDASASGVLPESYSGTDKGRATNGAAYALLAKVNLVWAQTSPDGNGQNKTARLTAAVAAANNVKGYSLEEEFLENWNTARRNGKENIFSAHHVESQQSAGDGGNHLAHCSFATGFSQETPHLVISNISFYNKFDDLDQRKSGSYAKTLYNPEKDEYFVFGFPRFRKYIDTANILTTNLTRSIDRTILRYADVLLIKAEALNELNSTPNDEAYAAINQIRRRAFRQSLTKTSIYDVPTGLSYEQFRDTVREERFKEFVYEQQRWFDLVRWRILVETVKPVINQNMVKQLDDNGDPLKDDSGNEIFKEETTHEKAAISLKHYRFPIPQSQRNINPEGLWQNWGWDGYDEAKTGKPYEGFK